MHRLKQRVAMHSNRATGMRQGDKRTFVVWCESSGQVVTTLQSCLCVHPGHGWDSEGLHTWLLLVVARAPEMGSPSRSAADNRPFCVREAGGVYFLDVGLIFQAPGQTEGWPLSPS